MCLVSKKVWKNGCENISVKLKKGWIQIRKWIGTKPNDGTENDGQKWMKMVKNIARVREKIAVVVGTIEWRGKKK